MKTLNSQNFPSTSECIHITENLDKEFVAHQSGVEWWALIKIIYYLQMETIEVDS